MSVNEIARSCLENYRKYFLGALIVLQTKLFTTAKQRYSVIVKSARGEMPRRRNLLT